MNRRNFLLASAGSLSALEVFSHIDRDFATRFERHINALENQSLPEGTENEDFWGWIRESFTVSPNIINLNNGGVSPQPKIVQDAHMRNNQLCNEAPSYYMWRILDQGREGLRHILSLRKRLGH